LGSCCKAHRIETRAQAWGQTGTEQCQGLTAGRMGCLKGQVGSVSLHGSTHDSNSKRRDYLMELGFQGCPSSQWGRSLPLAVAVS
jgi:hypothetical protein